MENRTENGTATGGRTAAPSLPPGTATAVPDYGEWLASVCRVLKIDARIGHEALAPRLMDDFRAGMPPAAAAQRAREWIGPTDN